MGNKVKSIGLIGLGMVAGITASLQFSAIAQKVTGSPLPLEELRQLSDVFGLIKSDYVENVDDKKLLTEAITGMVSSLDPHSVYLDKKAFREMRETVAGKFVGGEGLVVLTWDSGADRTLDTGLLVRHRSERPALVQAVQTLIPGEVG